MEIKVEKGNFTTTFNDIFNAEVDSVKLAPEAWGLYIYMLSLPEDWDFTIRGLASVINAGVNKIQRILKELELAGFIERNQPFKDGKFGKIQYTILTIPKKVKNSEKNSKKNTNKDNKSKLLKNNKTDDFEVEPCTRNPYTENSDTKQSTKEQISNTDKLMIKANSLPDSYHFLLQELISKNIVSIFDYKIQDFNNFFFELDKDFGIDVVLEATRYVASYYLKKKPFISCKFSWFSESIKNNVIKLTSDEVNMNDVLKQLSFNKKLEQFKNAKEKKNETKFI